MNTPDVEYPQLSPHRRRFCPAGSPLKTNIWEPEILHAEDSVGAFERGIQLGPLVHVTGDDFRAEGCQFLDSRLVYIARESADFPSIC